MPAPSVFVPASNYGHFYKSSFSFNSKLKMLISPLFMTTYWRLSRHHETYSFNYLWFPYDAGEALPVFKIFAGILCFFCAGLIYSFVFLTMVTIIYDSLSTRCL